MAKIEDIRRTISESLQGSGNLGGENAVPLFTVFKNFSTFTVQVSQTAAGIASSPTPHQHQKQNKTKQKNSFSLLP